MGRVKDEEEPPLADDEQEAAETPHYVGHRERLRNRFLKAGEAAFQDYELLELLLFSAIPRRDVKPIAKALLKEFGSLWTIVNASPAELQRRGGLGPVAAASIGVVAAVSRRMHWQHLEQQPALRSWQSVLDYCERVLAHETREQVRILFLDRKNQLIVDELQQSGTVDQAPLYPREVVRRALDLGATAFILVHNHPSGDPQPSRADIEITKDIVKAATALGITVHDHLIVGKGRHYSFKQHGLV